LQDCNYAEAVPRGKGELGCARASGPAEGWGKRRRRTASSEASGWAGARDPEGWPWAGSVRNLEAETETHEIPGDGRVTRDHRSIIDAPTVIPVPVCSAEMMVHARGATAGARGTHDGRAELRPATGAAGFRLVFALVSAAVALAASACGASQQTTHDGTTVTLEHPGDDGGAPPNSGAAPSPTK